MREIIVADIRELLKFNATIGLFFAIFAERIFSIDGGTKEILDKAYIIFCVVTMSYILGYALFINKTLLSKKFLAWIKGFLVAALVAYAFLVMILGTSVYEETVRGQFYYHLRNYTTAGLFWTVVILSLMSFTMIAVGDSIKKFRK